DWAAADRLCGRFAPDPHPYSSELAHSMRARTLLAACLLLLATEPAWAAGVEESVVKINVTARQPDYFRAWTKASPSQSAVSGVIIDGHRILTNAHVVLFASEVFVQLKTGGDQLTGKVVAVAPGIDLALVELVDPTAIEHLTPVPIADALPQVKSQVSVYG